MAKTLRDYHIIFLEELKRKKKAASTLLAYGKDVEQLIDELEKASLIEPLRIEQQHIENFTKDLSEKRYTEKSIVRKINSIKAFFVFLRDMGVVEKNPVAQVEKPKYEITAPRILTKIEYRALRDACRADRRISAIVEVLLQTGMRISELATLNIDDLDLVKRTVIVRNPENNTWRLIPLNNAAVRALQDYLGLRPKTREKTVFVTKTCKPFLVRNIRASIDRYFKFAGIQGAKVNDLRHTFIVEQLAAGTPLVHVTQLVGHRRVTTTEKYLQFLDKHVDTSTIRIEEL